MDNGRSKSLGLCFGASTVSAVWLEMVDSKIRIENHRVIPHQGDPKSILKELFRSNNITNISITGRKFKSLLNITSISEPEAVELAYQFTGHNAEIIISLGGENFIVYEIDSNGKISKPYTGNKCASGTGEFFLQQIKRMNLDVEEAVSLAVSGEAFSISGRCSVFCKSDCTHAMNKGVPKANVTAGLTKMMANKIIELTSRSDMQNALLIGGVTRNLAVLNHLTNAFEKLIIPKEAEYFEALGAALFAITNETRKINYKNIFKEEKSSFAFFDDLKKFKENVLFNSFVRSKPLAGDTVILGVDVGSTTTKAVLLRVSDNSILVSEYLRTNGDPVTASVQCYKSLKKQVNVPVNIIGIGVTGSGRYISGLHAQTKGIINEIIAHAAATVFFDKEVDTIFEIGGQDAKYTFITNSVPSDYAMNEACSAGTGSFLEEAAKECLGIDYEDIGNIALKADRAPNFNDQCSAFISSDIKNALHEGLTKEEIVAGLVYSICLNYTNRVKGNRPIGKKIFMQGGVCYNKAVPIAMSAITGKEIIVPPEPGLMGAFGVALEIKKRIDLSLIDAGSFDLDDLINRKVEYGKSFICKGGTEKCDRKCSISLISVDGKKFPFGGACNKYYNIQNDAKVKIKANNLVKLRQELVFEKYLYSKNIPGNSPVIGIPKSFDTNTFYPLYFNFFTQLGFKVILSDTANAAGIEKQQAAFCYPAELAHGFIFDLIHKKPDFIFLPHILEIHNENSDFKDKACVFIQAENFYLRAAFKNLFHDIKVLSPAINFADDHDLLKKTFIKIARELGCSKQEGSTAFDFAISIHKEMINEFHQVGKLALEELEKDKSKFAVVLVGRSYNAFAREANLGIPQKFSSRNVTIIPHDFLSVSDEKSSEHMYWGMGRQILRAGRFVKKHPQLFASYITNFSCGPDSFLIGYFRDIMEDKPSLTLELDSHCADAGLNTRIEAFLDVVKSYIQLSKKICNYGANGFRPLSFIDKTNFIDSHGSKLSIFDPSVKLLLPNMGRLLSEAGAASFRHIGIRAEALPIYTSEILKHGRGNTTCKECLPLILVAGSLGDYYAKRKSNNERTIMFIPTADGPCRLGQYRVFLSEFINKRQLENIGIFHLSDEDNYDGLGGDFDRRFWMGMLISDIMYGIQNAIRVIALHKSEASKVFNEEWKEIIKILEHGTQNEFYKQLEKTVNRLLSIERKFDYADVPKVIIVGEIFVRNDEFSLMDLIERLEEQNIVAQIAPVSEFLHYADYLIKNGLTTEKYNITQKTRFKIKNSVKRSIERKIRKIMSRTGLCSAEITDIDAIVDHADHLINPLFTGEAILTVGSALHEILHNVSGVISIGPFGCMPSRVAEAILNVEMNIKGKEIAEGRSYNMLSKRIKELPYLAIETDGNQFPQIIQSRIEIFILQTKRLHNILKNGKEQEKSNFRTTDVVKSPFLENHLQPVI